jgi:integrase
VRHHAQDAVDAEPGVPEAGATHSLVQVQACRGAPGIHPTLRRTCQRRATLETALYRRQCQWSEQSRCTGAKNRDPRTVHLNQNADAVLARRWSPDAKGLVFGGRNWNSFRSAWETALRTARIENFRFHDLRHTFASWAVQRGATLQEVTDLLGHKTLAMTLRYAHLAPERLRAAGATLDGILLASPQDAAPIADGRKVGARESTPLELERLAVS